MGTKNLLAATHWATHSCDFDRASKLTIWRQRFPLYVGRFRMMYFHIHHQKEKIEYCKQDILRCHQSQWSITINNTIWKQVLHSSFVLISNQSDFIKYCIDSRRISHTNSFFLFLNNLEWTCPLFLH